MKPLPPAEYWDTDRIDIGDGESIPTHTDAIRPGDWIIHHTLRYPLMGKVVKRVILSPGRLNTEGFLIDTVQGRQDFIELDQAMIMGLRYQEA